MFEGLKEVQRLVQQQNENIQVQNSTNLIPKKDIMQPQKQVGWRSGKPLISVVKNSPLFDDIQLGDASNTSMFSLFSALDCVKSTLNDTILKNAKCVQYINEARGIKYVVLYSGDEPIALASSANFFQVLRDKRTPTNDKYLRAFTWALTGRYVSSSDLRACYGTLSLREPDGRIQSHSVYDLRTLNKIITKNGCLSLKVVRNDSVGYSVIDTFTNGTGRNCKFQSRSVRGIAAFLIKNQIISKDQLFLDSKV